MSMNAVEVTGLIGAFGAILTLLLQIKKDGENKEAKHQKEKEEERKLAEERHTNLLTEFKIMQIGNAKDNELLEHKIKENTQSIAMLRTDFEHHKEKETH